MLIYWHKRKRLHKKRVQLPEDFLGTPTWPPFHCFGTTIWPPWRHVKTLFPNLWLIANFQGRSVHPGCCVSKCHGKPNSCCVTKLGYDHMHGPGRIFDRLKELTVHFSPHGRESGFGNPRKFYLWNPESWALKSEYSSRNQENPANDWNPEFEVP